MIERKQLSNTQNNNLEIKTLKFSKIWMFIIILSFSFSLINLGINLNLINIEKITFLGKENIKSIVDYSVNSNITTDVMVKNIIDSTTNIDYSKTTQILSNDLPEIIMVKNNDKINYHNYILHDKYENDVFFKEFPYNKFVQYGRCNEEFTNCVVYSSFLMDNNKENPPCWEVINQTEFNGYFIGTLKKLENYYKNPSDCFDYVNISSID